MDLFGIAIHLTPNDYLSTAMTGTEKLDQMRDAARLAGGETRYKLFFEMSQDLLCIAGPDGYFKAVNPAWTRVLGYSEAEILGTPFMEFIHPDDRAPTLEEAERLDAGEPTICFENRYRCKDGSYKWLQWTATPSPCNGEVLGIARDTTFMRAQADELREARASLEARVKERMTSDVTQSRELQRQLLRAQRMESIGTLSGGIAHDLNNVLTPILMSIELLRRRLGDSSDNTLDILESSAKRGAELVRHILSFGRAIEGDPVPVHLQQMLSALKKLTAGIFPGNIDVVVDLPEDLWPVCADPVQMEQLFMNLVVNARDAMPDGGKLTLYGRNVLIDDASAKANVDARAGSYCCIAVSDTGIGMPPEVQDRIFEPFFTTKQKTRATGLGLSTALTIVRSHHGFIETHSEQGRGSTFKVYLPAMSSEDRAAPAGHSQPQRWEIHK